MFDKNEWQRRWRQRRKAQVMERYGGARCVCCGETELAFLALNHISGGGNQHRKAIGGNGQAAYEWAIKNGFPPIFNVLCHNCNLAIGHFGTCPHKRG